jgi:magnesium-transporting ATPase (P-type)
LGGVGSAGKSSRAGGLWFGCVGLAVDVVVVVVVDDDDDDWGIALAVLVGITAGITGFFVVVVVVVVVLVVVLSSFEPPLKNPVRPLKNPFFFVVVSAVVVVVVVGGVTTICESKSDWE